MKNLQVFYLVCLITLVTIAPGYSQKKGKLTTEEKGQIKNARVVIFRYEAPPLTFMTPKDAVGAGLVSKVTKSDIGESQERHRYYPSKLVQKNLDSLFRAHELMTNVTLVPEAFEFHMPAKLKDLSKYDDVDTDYIVEVIVPLMTWKASYSPAKWRTYWLGLGVEVRVIRKSDLTRVWKTNVGHGGLNDKRLKFHITELEENGKEKIAQMLDIAALEAGKRVIESYIAAKK